MQLVNGFATDVSTHPTKPQCPVETQPGPGAVLKKSWRRAHGNAVGRCPAAKVKHKYILEYV